MGIQLTHPERQRPQIVFSERDAMWLESKGWHRKTSEQPVDIPVAESTSPAKEGSDDEVTTIQKVSKPKRRGRGRKFMVPV